MKPLSLLLSALLLSGVAAADSGPVTPTFIVDSVASGTEGEPVVAWLGDHVLVVFRSTSGELRGRYIKSDGTPVAPSFLIRDTQVTGLIGPPTVGVLQNTAVGDRFLVAWSREGNVAQDREIEIMALEPGVAAAGTVVAVTNNGGLLEDVQPALPAWSSGETTLLWTVLNNGIKGCRIAIDGAGDPDPVTTFTVSNNGLDSHPGLVKMSGGPLVLSMAVWHRNDSPTGDAIRALHWTGPVPSPTQPSFAVLAGAGAYGPPAIACTTNRDCVILWDRTESGTTGPRDVIGRRIYFPSPYDLGPRFGNVTEVAAQPGLDEYAPDVAFAGDSYAVTARAKPSFFDQVFLLTIDTLKSFVVDSHVITSGSAIHGCSVSAQTKQNSEDRVLVAWGDTSSTGSIEGRFAQADGGLHESYEVGCPTLGGFPMLSSVVDGNASFRMEIWHGEPGGAPYMAVSDEAWFVPIGGATLVPRLDTASAFFGGNFDVTGYTGVDVVLPPGLSGVDLYGQWLTLSPGFQCTNTIVGLSDGFRIRVD